jgi:hypothetical protein
MGEYGNNWEGMLVGTWYQFGRLLTSCANYEIKFYFNFYLKVL